MIRAVVFDLDDTLISEKQYIESGFSYVASLISQKYLIPKEEIFYKLSSLFASNPKNVFDRYLNENKLSTGHNEVNVLVEAFRNHSPDISFYSDVLPFVKWLRSNGIKTGIITDGYANAQRKKLESLKAQSFFDEIVLTDEIGHNCWKPHPIAFERMREKLNVEFCEMIFVGDNPEKDFFINKTYPIITVRVYRRGVHEDKFYREGIREMYSVERLMEISGIILQCSIHGAAKK